jgi:hypothetical protein
MDPGERRRAGGGFISISQDDPKTPKSMLDVVTMGATRRRRPPQLAVLDE